VLLVASPGRLAALVDVAEGPLVVVDVGADVDGASSGFLEGKAGSVVDLDVIELLRRPRISFL
jgi:hypothetical protein